MENITKTQITTDGRKIILKPKNKFEELLWIWDYVFDKFSHKNENVGRICFYVFISQYFQDLIKMRIGVEVRPIQISSLIFRPSRSGKGQALKVVKLFCEKSGLSFEQSNELTSASLIGSFDYEKYGALLKALHRNPSEEDLERIKNECSVKGILYGDRGIVAFPEIHDVLSNVRVVNHLQTATDSYPFVDKDLKSERIHYEVNKSIIGTSIFLDELKDIILRKGLIQRMLIHMSDVPIQEREEINRRLIDDLWAVEDTTKVDFYVNYFVREIEAIRKRTKEKIFEISKVHKQKIRTLLLSKTKTVINFITENYSGEEYKLATTWSTSIIDLFFKCAVVSAILNENETINYWDFFDTIEIVIKNIENVLYHMFPKIFKYKENSIKYKILNILKQKPLSKSELLETLRTKKIVSSPNKYKRIIDNLLESNYIKIRKEETKEAKRPKEFLILCNDLF